MQPIVDEMIHSSVGQAGSWPQTEHSGDARCVFLSDDGVESLQKKDGGNSYLDVRYCIADNGIDK